MTTSLDLNERIETYTVVQSVLDDNRYLDLHSRDIALLVLIKHQIESRNDLAFSIAESEIRALSDRLDDVAARDPQGAEKRITECLNRLLRAECLTRADMNRLMTVDTEYQLTTLGEAIASWQIEQCRFSGEPLTAILRAFNSQLATIASEAESVDTLDKWHQYVIVQMQFVIKDMLINGHRHQRELDRQHDALRSFIPTLLTENSEVSIELCEKQLAQVIKTIDDLQEVTLTSASTAFSLLDKIETLGLMRGFMDTEAACRDIERRLQSVVQWTTHRASDWVEHHNVVHDFLRTIIRVDRQRRLTEALKRAIAFEPDWTMAVTAEERMIRIRDEMLQERTTRQAPRVPKVDRTREIIEITPDDLRDKFMSILLERIDQGEAKLSCMLRQAAMDGVKTCDIVFHLPWLIGQMTAAGRIDSKARLWEKVTDCFEIEELRVTKDDIHG